MTTTKKNIKKSASTNNNGLAKVCPKHNSFISEVANSTRNVNLNPVRKYKQVKYSRAIGTKTDSDDFKSIVAVEDKYLSPTLKLHPESAAFLFFIDGCAKNLFFYLILFELNSTDNTFNFNTHTIDKFIEYSTKHFGQTYTEDTVGQALRNLGYNHIVCNSSTGIYVMNPLIVGGVNDASRRLLFKSYTNLLISKGKNPKTDMYPLYKRY